MMIALLIRDKLTNGTASIRNQIPTPRQCDAQYSDSDRSLALNSSTSIRSISCHLNVKHWHRSPWLADKCWIGFRKTIYYNLSFAYMCLSIWYCVLNLCIWLLIDVKDIHVKCLEFFIPRLVREEINKISQDDVETKTLGGHGYKPSIASDMHILLLEGRWMRKWRHKRAHAPANQKRNQRGSSGDFEKH